MTIESTLPVWAQRLIELRSSRGWVVADTARELKQRRGSLPSVKDLTHMVRGDWESGKHRPGPQYRALLSAVYGVNESEIFGDDRPPPQAPSGDDDEVERRRLLQALAVLGASASPMTGALANVREALDSALSNETDHMVSDWEETAAEHARRAVEALPDGQRTIGVQRGAHAVLTVVPESEAGRPAVVEYRERLALSAGN